MFRTTDGLGDGAGRAAGGLVLRSVAYLGLREAAMANPPRLLVFFKDLEPWLPARPAPSPRPSVVWNAPAP